MKPLLALVVGLAITACTPLVCKNGGLRDPVLCGREAGPMDEQTRDAYEQAMENACTTDTDCAERFGGDGGPEPT